MLSRKIRILNFDDSVIKQRGLLEKYENIILDLRDMEEPVRHWMSAKVRKEIAGRIPATAQNAITFLGSGDFHHISEILINALAGPMSVIVFDFHPDWDTSPPRFGCGSWLNQVLRMKNVSKVILIGVSSDDISSKNINSGNLASLSGNRVEIYPYAHGPSKTFLKKIPDNISIKAVRGVFFNTIYWQELRNKNLQGFFQQLLERLPSKRVYVSIDKDCLAYDSALTNWEEGNFSLDQLLLMLKLIKERLDIIGLDITGDYSKIHFSGICKKFFSYLDHPRDAKPLLMPKGTITALNEKTNLRILELLTEEN